MAAPAAKRKNALKLILFALLPATLLFIVAETCATFATARDAQRTKDAATGQMQYTLRIGKFPWSRKSVTPLNSQGYPDVEFANLPAKNDCVHIVFAGDSFIFGDGVDRDSSFVGLLRSWSGDPRSGHCVRVFNLGTRGTTINRQAASVRQTLAVLQPDIVLLGQYQNDLTDLAHPNVNADTVLPAGHEINTGRMLRDRFGSLDFNLVRFLAYHAFATAIKRDIHYDLLHHWSILADTARKADADRFKKDYEEAYVSLIRELAAQGIAFGVVIIPSKFDVLAGRFPEEAYFEELARKHRVPHLSVFRALDERRSPYTFLLYDGHLNEWGNRMVAQTIHEWLYDSEPPPFARLLQRDTAISEVRASR
jgi:hypothetical protein